jgi:hypothetical protein
VVSSTPRPHFTLRKDLVPIVQAAGWAPGPVWTSAENLAHTGLRSPDHPARSQLLYQLSYPAHKTTYVYVCIGIEEFFEDSYLPLRISHTVKSILCYQTELLQPCMSDSSITAHIFHAYKMFTLSQSCLPMVWLLGDCSSSTPVVWLLGDCSSSTPLSLTLRP